MSYWKGKKRNRHRIREEMVEHWKCTKCGKHFRAINRVDCPTPPRYPVCPKCANNGVMKE